MNQIIDQVSGLQYIPDFISQESHDTLLSAIDALPWLGDLKRRVQHYGYKYDYKKRAIDASMKVGDLPDWATNLAQQAQDQKLVPYVFDQVIVNEYQPGQGIARHVDCEPCFDDIIMSVSLGAPCVMHFTALKDGQDIPVILEPRSAVVLTGDARYKWQHSIRANKKEVAQGQTIVRARRVSLTFRKVILQA
ncbi:MAG TPA: alpha-ketoglutarate-dependent dioxygenase AlkB [Microscillaceae bacterium]|nr:alpha-ketoglutarate-dependent dioxygenase AlkB [Microscillaceae bacterium]